MSPWTTLWPVQRLSLSLIGQPGLLAANPTGNGNDGATIAATTCSRRRQIPCLISCNQYWRQNTPETEVVAPQSPAPRDRKRNRWLFSIIYSRKTNWKWKWWRSCSFLTITRDESFMTISLSCWVQTTRVEDLWVYVDPFHEYSWKNRDILRS